MQAIKLIWLKLFNTELCPKRCWRGPKPQEVGKTEEQYTVHCLTVHCHHRIDFCIQMSSDKNNFNVSLIVRGKVTRRRPQTTIFKERGAPKRYRTEVLLFTSLTPTAKPGATHYRTTLLSYLVCWRSCEERKSPKSSL